MKSRALQMLSANTTWITKPIVPILRGLFWWEAREERSVALKLKNWKVATDSLEGLIAYWISIRLWRKVWIWGNRRDRYPRPAESDGFGAGLGWHKERSGCSWTRRQRGRRKPAFVASSVFGDNTFCARPCSGRWLPLLLTFDIFWSLLTFVTPSLAFINLRSKKNRRAFSLTHETDKSNVT